MQKAERIVVLGLLLITIAGVSGSCYSKQKGNSREVVSSDKAEALEDARIRIEKGKIVDINTANKFTLTRLPGIGPTLAQRIINSRRETGRFNSPPEIMRIKGIGPKKFESIKNNIIVNDE